MLFSCKGLWYQFTFTWTISRLHTSVYCYLIFVLVANDSKIEYCQEFINVCNMKHGLKNFLSCFIKYFSLFFLMKHIFLRRNILLLVLFTKFPIVYFLEVWSSNLVNNLQKLFGAYIIVFPFILLFIFTPNSIFFWSNFMLKYWNSDFSVKSI